MSPPLTPEQIASLTPEQRAYIDTQPEFARAARGWEALQWNFEQRRIRQGDRKRRLRRGDITRSRFDAESAADPVPPTSRGVGDPVQPPDPPRGR